MQTDSSASFTYLASASASECTTTVLMPSSRQARWMRNAISPRLAINIFSNMSALCGEIAFAAFSRSAIWLHRCAACRRLVTAVGNQDFFKHMDAPGLVSGAQLRQIDGLADDEQGLAELHRLAVFHQDGLDDPGLVGVDQIGRASCRE